MSPVSRVLADTHESQVPLWTSLSTSSARFLLINRRIYINIENGPPDTADWFQTKCLVSSYNTTDFQSVILNTDSDSDAVFLSMLQKFLISIGQIFSQLTLKDFLCGV